MVKRWIERGNMWVKVEFKNEPGTWKVEEEHREEKPTVSMLLPALGNNPVPGKPGRWIARERIGRDER